MRHGDLSPQPFQHNPNLVLCPEFSPRGPSDLRHHISRHVSSFLFMAQALYPEPTGTSRSGMVQSQQHQLSTKNSQSRFPFSLTTYTPRHVYPCKTDPLMPSTLWGLDDCRN